MEFLQEAIATRNIVFWIILLVLLIFLFKILKSVARCILKLTIIIGIIALLVKFFPGLFEPMIDFVRDAWLGNQGHEKP
ncbi:MAG: hypothetical protein VX051_05125 [Verrucomicrobiota bacterium]|nr:hypothetical protein [Verrucomicrobiota bacterium]